MVDGHWHRILFKTERFQVSDSAYDSQFRYNTWIKGENSNVPTTPTQLFCFTVESMDWSRMLVTSSSYEIRQNFFRDSGLQEFDAYSFVYNAYVIQDDGLPQQTGHGNLQSSSIARQYKYLGTFQLDGQILALYKCYVKCRIPPVVVMNTTVRSDSVLQEGDGECWYHW